MISRLTGSPPPGANVNLLTGAASGGDAEGDFLEGMESIAGSAFADVLTGNDADNEITGYEGNDTLAGGAGMTAFPEMKEMTSLMAVTGMMT